jgi:hypothetical protein
VHGHGSVKDAVLDNKKCGRGNMARNRTSLEDAHALLKKLIAEKVQYLVPMTIIFIVCYIG